MSRFSQKKVDKPVAIIHQYEKKIKTALKADVDDLLKEFSKGPVTYEYFLQCYREADFWTIFIGRFTPTEEFEFAEDFFHYVVSLIFPNELRAKCYQNSKKSLMPEVMLAETEKNEQLFGIFLCYTAFFMQAQTDVRLIPLKVDLAEALPNMLQLQQERQLQPLYCLQRLITSKAFMIIPFDEDHNPLLMNRFRNTEDDLGASSLITDFERLKNVSESQDLKYLAEINEKYERMKKEMKLPKEFSQTANDLNLKIQNLTTEAIEKYKNASIVVPTQPSNSILSQISELRRKAVEGDVVIPRHRRHKYGLGFYDMAPINLNESDDESQDLPTSSTAGKKRQTEEDVEVLEESPTQSPVKSKRGRAKKIKEVDHLQVVAKTSITKANKKQERIRRETITEEGEEPTLLELVRREVEVDLEAEREKQTRRRSPRKSRTDSTATSIDTPSTSTTSTRRRSTRLVKNVSTTKSSTISQVEATTEITKKAIEALQSGNLADLELKKLKAKKK